MRNTLGNRTVSVRGTADKRSSDIAYPPGKCGRRGLRLLDLDVRVPDDLGPARGVFAGANMPFQLLTPNPETVSPMAGSSGSSGWRCGGVTANARSLPELMCGSTTT